MMKCAAGLSGYGLECSDLDTDESCTHTCQQGYNDNNHGEGQTYHCVDGIFSGTPLVCTGNMTKLIYLQSVCWHIQR